MQLAPGMVLYLNFPTMRPFPKEKFALLCCLEPTPLFLLINTDRNAFIVNTEELAEHHLVIDAANHDFLRYDSLLDCSAPFGYSSAELLEALRDDPTRVRGKISATLLEAIIACLTASDLWPPKKMASVLNGLTKGEPVDF